VAVAALRAAIDWFEVRHPRPPSRPLPDGVAHLLSWEGSDAAEPRWVLPLVCGRRPGGDWTGRAVGLHLLVDRHGLRVQVQGALLARVASGGEALVLDVLRSVLAWAHPGDGAVEAELVDPLLAHRDGLRVTRLDVATDIAVSHRADDGVATPADDWLDRAVWGCGAVDSATRASDLWASRAKRHEQVTGEDTESEEGLAPVRLLGRRRERAATPTAPPEGRDLPVITRPGRTLYVGSRAHSQVCVYEKDLAPRTSASTVLALETLRDRCGWDRVARVLRVEHRLGSAWWRDQVFALRDGRSVRADRLDAIDLLTLVPQIAAAAIQRQRHTDATDATVRRRRRRSSAIQTVIERAVARWADRTGATDLDAVISRRREAVLGRQRRAVMTMLARLWGATGSSPLALAGSLAADLLRLVEGTASLTRDERVLADRLTTVRDRARDLWGDHDVLVEHLARISDATSVSELARVAIEAHDWAAAQRESPHAAARERSGTGVVRVIEEAYCIARERLAA
jgi:hypothetical protein